jgi:hypothetical protein
VVILGGTGHWVEEHELGEEGDFLIKGRMHIAISFMTEGIFKLTRDYSMIFY